MVEADIEKLTNRLKKAVGEISRLQKALNAEQKTTERLEAVNTQLHESIRQTEDKGSEIVGKLEMDIAMLQQQIEDLQNENSEAYAHYEKLNNQRIALQEKNSRLASHSTEFETTIRELVKKSHNLHEMGINIKMYCEGQVPLLLKNKK